jgi:hypothetical protein
MSNKLKALCEQIEKNPDVQYKFTSVDSSLSISMFEQYVKENKPELLDRCTFPTDQPSTYRYSSGMPIGIEFEPYWSTPPPQQALGRAIRFQEKENTSNS